MCIRDSAWECPQHRKEDADKSEATNHDTGTDTAPAITLLQLLYVQDIKYCVVSFLSHPFYFTPATTFKSQTPLRHPPTQIAQHLRTVSELVTICCRLHQEWLDIPWVETIIDNPIRSLQQVVWLDIVQQHEDVLVRFATCLLYTSDAADE